jgi:hypothetical protein
MQRNHLFKASPGKVRVTLSQKQNTNKRAKDFIQVAKCLPITQEILGSVTSNLSYPFPLRNKEKEEPASWRSQTAV